MTFECFYWNSLDFSMAVPFQHGNARLFSFPCVKQSMYKCDIVQMYSPDLRLGVSTSRDQFLLVTHICIQDLNLLLLSIRFACLSIVCGRWDFFDSNAYN